MATPTYRLGVDVGGTFTDLLLLDTQSGLTRRAKVPSTPEDQSIAVTHGVEELLATLPNHANLQVETINHGSTVATNAILEKTGAKVALIVTEGYKDVLQTRRSQVPGGLASWIIWQKPEPLAPLELTIEAPGRISTNGNEVYEFDKKAFVERLQALQSMEVDAFTVSFLNAFANPDHERQARSVLSEVFPDKPVSLSSEVLPEMMEYERTMTTVANSYIEPRVSTYLNNLLRSLEGQTKHLRILRSDGGLSSIPLACKYPVTTALSGPAGGVSGVASLVAAETRFKNLITLDMGGTSTDVALIENGTPKIRRETKIGDLVIRAPSVDVRTVGAGGGSVVQVPEVTKAVRVGPSSAGARPGPACYGKGGKVATVTDANAVCGYLPEYLLGGKFKLDLDAARESVRQVSQKIGVTVSEAAEGILQVVNETMYGALRVVSVEQGYDPRNFSLVAFGGAGPLHACALGKLLGSWPVIVPPSPGVLCAWGDATALLRHEVSTTFIRKFSQTNPEQILSAFDVLLGQASQIMREEQGVPNERQVYKYQVDMRYIGQALSVNVSFDISAFRKNGLSYIRKVFEAEHERLFTFKLENDMEIINLRLAAEELKLDMKMQEVGQASGDVPEAAMQYKTTLIYDGKEYDSPVWIRSELKRGHLLSGPCVITEMDSNTLILPGYKAEVDHVGNILIWEVLHQSSKAGSNLEIDQVDSTLSTVVTDIFENALRNARNEMDTLLTTVTMSPAIREQQDEFNVIAEPSGKMIVGQFGSFIGQLLRMWKGTIDPGDIFITNDPYSVGGSISHLNDYLVCLPIFVGEKLIAWAAQFGHHTDTGGSVPGSLPTSASQIFEEGIQIPVTKLASKGVWNTDMMELIYRNSRLPDWVQSDTKALVAACNLAARRMIELYQRFGDKLYFEAIDELLERNKKAISSIFDQSIPDKPVYYEDWIDDDGKGVGPWKIACTMSKENGRLNFDFTGTDPQSSSSVNFYLSDNMWKMFVGIYLITVYDPNTVVNDGFHDLIDFHVPLGTILNPVRPAALSTRTHLLGRVMDLLCGLLGQKAPEFMTAGGFSDSPHFFFSGWRPDGSWFELYQIGFGGIPGRPAGDGMDGHCLWPAMKSVPNEFLELYYPLRIEQYSTVTDSGGAGLYRGGNGQRIHYRFLDEGEISLHDDRWLSKPFGVLGGDPGARSSKVLVRDGKREVLPSKIDHIKVSEGDLLEWVTWGGGGWGDPLERDPELVLLEVRRRLISSKGARRYGVVVKDLAIDHKATKELRQEMAMAKKDTGIFNRGGTWEELLENCYAETGLRPPVPPGKHPMRGPHTGLPHIRQWMAEHGQALPALSETAGINGVARKRS